MFPVREVLAADATNDLVILRVEGRGFVPVPLALGARQGSPVWVLSHPGYNYYTLTTGMVERYLIWPFLKGEPTYMSITADFGVGSSGAPVFNDHGAVVGIAKITKGIEADAEQKDKTNLQMVLKYCTPSAALLKMISPE